MSVTEIIGLVLGFLTLQGSFIAGLFKVSGKLTAIETELAVLKSQVADMRSPPTRSGEHRFSIPPKRSRSKS